MNYDVCGNGHVVVQRDYICMTVLAKFISNTHHGTC